MERSRQKARNSRRVMPVRSRCWARVSPSVHGWASGPCMENPPTPRWVRTTVGGNRN